MIPSTFTYEQPADVSTALEIMSRAAPDPQEADGAVTVLAGGQSLVPLLRFRLAAPDVVVDLGGCAELQGIRDMGDHLWIGAMTTHHDVIRDPLVAEHCGLLAQATRTVADPAVRHRGTIGGSLAHADPAGDLPAVALTLNAEMIIDGPDGQREVPAGEFFLDYLTSALEPDELLTGIRIPKWPGWTFHYEKFNRTAQAWALVGVAAAVQRVHGDLAEVRVGLTNMGATPVRARGVEQAARGIPAQRRAVTEASRQASSGTEPPSDTHAQSDYRRHLAQVLTGRAISRAAGL
ncbi:xanthine dehydrogenase family protein subunit M [Lipingzhangella sp. LS1_29]|uniref:Xanthine dehydrogenase family protein subunit M n=1 Tax=Lipingzhangella rawalii TaxID=2055835 RepID=A0ABU2H4U7_9ACTN|nr:xanthine dehydrogenase family protein subunit M [Lipingzhangella rawalii]MDS1269865.1 xanthine dehydrogenase family protein subunit M [Lipingzhangella rawalii]